MTIPSFAASIAPRGFRGAVQAGHRNPTPRTIGPVNPDGHPAPIAVNVIKANLLNRGTDLWKVEHECKRPSAAGLIYAPEKVQAAVTS